MRKVFACPIGPAKSFEPPGHLVMGGQEIAHVIEGVTDLSGRQRAIAPLGQRFGLGELHSQQLMDQRAGPQGIGQPDQPRRDLQIENVAGRLPRPQPAQPHLFAAGVNDDQVLRIDHQTPKGIERTHHQRIDEIKTLRRGDLHQTEMRMVGIFADKLGIEAEAAAGSQLRSRRLIRPVW